MSSGEQSVYATAWVAMAFYWATLLTLSTMPSGERRTLRARRLWTAGCVFYLLHVAAAFYFVHHGSHTAAAESTSRRTAEATGIATNAGIYFNYLFTLIWACDVGWWWLASETYSRRPRLVSRLIHGFLFFMAFNAVVVFGQGLTRGLGILGCAILIVLRLRRHKRP